MGKYLLERNKKVYYRRRIPIELTKYFPNMIEIRLQVSQRSKFRAIMSIDILNSLFEELITMLFLDATDETQSLVMKYMIKMKDYANGNTPIIIYPTEQFFNEENTKLDTELHEKFDSLNLIKKKRFLENLNSLDKLINIIDPKNDLRHISHTTRIEEPKQTGVNFKELYEIFLKEKKRNNPTLSDTTCRDYTASYKDFIFVLNNAENRDIASFTREDFETFLEALHEHIPVRRSILKKFRDLSYDELIDITLEDSEKMELNTKQKKMLTIKQIFDIAVDNKRNYLQENLAQAFLIKDQTNARKKPPKRRPLTDENLTKLFSSKFYTSKLELTLSIEPEQYWIPLIALYSGLRQNEIAQLSMDNIKKEEIDTGDTIWYFDINEEDERSLKNFNATRLVPIHPKLIELGFLDYYERIKKSHDRLFPNLRFHPIKKKYGTDYSKNFGKFFRNYITNDKTQVFHSLRHNAGDQLMKNAVNHKLPKDLMNRLMGHEPDKDMTSVVYSLGYGIKELYEGIKTLEFDFHTSII